MENGKNVRYTGDTNGELEIYFSIDEVRKEIRNLHTGLLEVEGNILEIQQSLKTLIGVTGLIVILMGAILIWG
tara:strand:+ start:1669 stop:1887 length:219 start_codon:yes stop_codon:yes gene_type:complete